jgi:hypothetical protein
MGSSSSTASEPGLGRPSWWVRFWHEPLRAERLALTRLLFGLALLTDQLFQYLPNFREFFGPEGVAPAGLHDAWLLQTWRWTALFFHTDDLGILYPAFFAWVAVTALWTLGFCTRLTNVGVWFGALCFLNRNPNLLNGGDRVLQAGLFLLMLSPCGRALSLDALLRRWWTGRAGPAYTPAWPVRLIQIQLCLIYLSTGLVKLKGEWAGGPFEFKGTWWEGTSIHYALNYVTMSRWSFAQLPLPLWLTAALTYVCVWWETLFPLLVLPRWTRGPALWFGVLFHLGIYFTIEVGWFSFYTLAFYGVWVPEWFWQRGDAPREVTVPAPAVARPAPAEPAGVRVPVG